MQFLSKNNQSAFTMIELLVVITIIGIIFSASFMNYAYAQRKLSVRQWAQLVWKTIIDTKNLAKNGFETWVWSAQKNVSLALEFDTSETALANNKLQLVSYEIGENPQTANATLVEVFPLPRWVQIDWISFDGGNNFETSADFFFESINPENGIFFDENDQQVSSITDSNIAIKISFKWASGPLSKVIQYDIRSWVFDY